MAEHLCSAQNIPTQKAQQYTTLSYRLHSAFGRTSVFCSKHPCPESTAVYHTLLLAAFCFWQNIGVLLKSILSKICSHLDSDRTLLFCFRQNISVLLKTSLPKKHSSIQHSPIATFCFWQNISVLLKTSLPKKHSSREHSLL